MIFRSLMLIIEIRIRYADGYEFIHFNLMLEKILILILVSSSLALAREYIKTDLNSDWQMKILRGPVVQ